MPGTRSASASRDACQANGQCDPQANATACVGIDIIYDTVNYVPHDLSFTKDGCVKPSTQVGVNNHVEIQFSATGIVVWMSDAGGTVDVEARRPRELRSPVDAWAAVDGRRPLQRRQVQHATDEHVLVGQLRASMARSSPATSASMSSTTRSAGGTAENGLPMTNLGYPIPQNSTGINLTFPNVTNTTVAAAALLELTYWPQTAQTLTYSLNGNPAHTFAWPFGSRADVRVADRRDAGAALGSADGTNTLKISTSDKSNGVPTANYDLIIVPVRGAVPPCRRRCRRRRRRFAGATTCRRPRPTTVKPVHDDGADNHGADDDDDDAGNDAGLHRQPHDVQLQHPVERQRPERLDLGQHHRIDGRRVARPGRNGGDAGEVSVHRNRYDQWAIKSHGNGKYVSAELNNTGRCTRPAARSDAVGTWETYTVQLGRIVSCGRSPRRTACSFPPSSVHGSNNAILRAGATAVGSMQGFNITPA